MKRNYVIYGAGRWGLKAIAEYGKENISYIIDNNVQLQGTELDGLKIVDFQHFLNDTVNPQVIIAVKDFLDIRKQLMDCGIDDYIIYVPRFESFFPRDILVYNTYEYRDEAFSEADYNEATHQNEILFLRIESRVEELKKAVPLFEHIEIETYNRCNGVCDFCPVSVKAESRKKCLMDIELFKKIIDELADLNYSGRLCLFSNNEPFLDSRIIELHKYARKMLPNARMHLYTNGTLLTLDKFIEIMKYLDELIIDNYNQELKLIPNARRIKEYCEEHPELIERVTIVLRKPKEILATRGGDAPNRHEKISYENTKCVNPFRQMIVRPDGKVSLCCNDPLGKNTMGDLNRSSVTEVWYGEEFRKVREALAKGRQYWPHCKYCDVFNPD
ncbi:MAG: SPASM domain-containing protein [Agathobacter sp.]|nr:SPASM domain-containing protein [Agathobacter sp.]